MLPPCLWSFYLKSISSAVIIFSAVNCRPLKQSKTVTKPVVDINTAIVYMSVIDPRHRWQQWWNQIGRKKAKTGRKSTQKTQEKKTGSGNKSKRTQTEEKGENKKNEMLVLTFRLFSDGYTLMEKRPRHLLMSKHEANQPPTAVSTGSDACFVSALFVINVEKELKCFCHFSVLLYKYFNMIFSQF